MIRIKTLLKEIEEDKNSNIASLEDTREWKLVEAEHLLDMKFKREGDSTFILNNPPMKVYKIKKGPFIVEEPIENKEATDYKKGMEAPMKPRGMAAFNQSKKINKYQFPNFMQVLKFFDSYKQD